MNIVNCSNFTQNDIFIMSKIYDKNTLQGLTKGKARTVMEIWEELDKVLSESKVRKTLAMLCNCGYVDYGIKKGKMKTYYITEEGLKYIVSLKQTSCKIIKESSK